jgi:hypothetical protein
MMLRNTKLVGENEDTEVKRRDGKPQNNFLASRANLMRNSNTDKAVAYSIVCLTLITSICRYCRSDVEI